MLKVNWVGPEALDEALEAILGSYCEGGLWRKAISILTQDETGIQPSDVIEAYTAEVKGCNVRIYVTKKGASPASGVVGNIHVLVSPGGEGVYLLGSFGVGNRHFQELNTLRSAIGNGTNVYGWHSQLPVGTYKSKPDGWLAQTLFHVAGSPVYGKQGKGGDGEERKAVDKGQSEGNGQDKDEEMDDVSKQFLEKGRKALRNVQALGKERKRNA